MPYYILQISDLHIGGRKRELQTFIKIKDFLLNSYDRPKDKTMLIITGDVTNQPNEDFYVNAKENIDQLVNGGFSVWPIPGNHDLCEDGWWFPKSEKIFEKKYIEGNPLLNGFTNTAYPHVKSDGGHHFFALNSMDRDYPGLHFAKGAIGGRQRNELKKKLKTGRRQGSMLMELLCEQTDILIFGHEHFQCDFSKSSYGKIYNIPVILSCARTTHKCREHSVAFDGKKDVMTKEKNSGRLGWEIIIKDNGSIVPKTIVFPV
jgi:calcineurin-like phosphoesterase family protein